MLSVVKFYFFESFVNIPLELFIRKIPSRTKFLKEENGFVKFRANAKIQHSVKDHPKILKAS
jgi:hypothetical protein